MAWVLCGLACVVVGCTTGRASLSTQCIELVRNWRAHPNGLTVAALLDLQTYAGTPGGAAVTARDWQSEVQQNGTECIVRYVVTAPEDVRVWKWTVDPSHGTVTPSNDLANQLIVFDIDVTARLGQPAVALATPVPTPSPTAVETPTPTPTPTPVPTETPTPLPAATQSPTATPVATPVPTQPPKPPGTVVYKGVMELGQQIVATLEIDGQYYQAYNGDTVGDGYKVLRLTPQQVDLSYHGQPPFTVRMAPHSGGVQFIPAPAQPTPQTEATPSTETPVELTPMQPK